jgi:hypothetical protein
MAIDISSLQTFSDSDLLKLYRWALATGAAGQSRTISGRSISFPNPKDLMDLIERLEARTSTDGGSALGVFGDPQ